MKNRQPLKDSILLCCEENGNKTKRVFSIIRKVTEGASVICYEAYYEGSGKGILKEFYPEDCYALCAVERDAEGNLVPSENAGEAYERFLKDEKDYFEPYELLLELKRKSENNDIASFIPNFEIYRGCSSGGKITGTTYIWTPDPESETFEKICGRIHENPDENPEYNLLLVLKAIEHLAKCVRVLHAEGVIHRDLKPSNFGFLKLGDETLTQTLSLFDINTVCSVYNCSDIAGSEGYMEPEAFRYPADCRTDIYSIGACLFNAIIITDETAANGYLYKDEYHPYLVKMVNDSKLIRASEYNSHPKLRSLLALILQRCLCERKHRYESCEALLQDLRSAIRYVFPSEKESEQYSGPYFWEHMDPTRPLGLWIKKDPMLSIQYHLYEYPIYKCLPRDEENVNVVVIGFGSYGSYFLDAALQAGQIGRKRLNVTVISDDPIYSEKYIEDRPELPKFFNVDASLEEDLSAGKLKETDIYGNISFEQRKFEKENPKVNKEILQDIMCEHYDSKRPCYVFIAMGDDYLNLSAAEACREVLADGENSCSINYVCADSADFAFEDSLVHPLYVNNDTNKAKIHREIERMALNTHLVWNRDLNVDFEEVKADFERKYNHDSCIAYVVSVKSKLYGVGIDPDFEGAEKAANLFAEKTAADENIRNELIWAEHKRWVTEKICSGWSTLENLEECAAGKTKDEKEKKHICILRSDPDKSLSSETYGKGWGRLKWDKSSAKEVANLDELDRMSVLLHRMYKRKAREASGMNLLSGPFMESIRSMAKENGRTFAAFQEWFTCLKDICNNETEKVKLYKGLKNAFIDSLAESNRKDAVCDQIDAFEKLFYPVIGCAEYRDWKQSDAALVDNIPFILTYTDDSCIAMPFVLSENPCLDKTEIFKNVASATVINPAFVLYLFYARENWDIERLCKNVPYVISYMNKKKLRAKVEFIVAFTEGIDVSAAEEQIKKACRGREVSVSLIEAGKITDVVEKITGRLKEKSAEREFFALELMERNNLSDMIEAAGALEDFQNYRFDNSKIEFRKLCGCDMLRYIKKKPHISVSEVAAFCCAASHSSNQPEFFDYRELWERYCIAPGIWKNLCNSLQNHREKNDTAARFKKNAPSSGEAKKYTYIIPSSCGRSAGIIISELAESGILEKESRVRAITTSSFEVLIFDRKNNKAEYDKLFANIYALMTPDAITFRTDPVSREFIISYDNLMVKDAPVNSESSPKTMELLEYFRDKGFIMNLKTAPGGKVSFTYATPEIKELLTTAGKMLEIHTFHKAKELGYFDDAVSSYEINWEEEPQNEEEEVKNEFDVILTKGFSSVFVECKARPNISADFYYKLTALTAKFGVNTTAVLVADTNEKEYFDNFHTNVAQRKRGNEMHLVTVWKHEEIENIGEILKDIIEGKYVSKER